jgi:hypothetical protein
MGRFLFACQEEFQCGLLIFKEEFGKTAWKRREKLLEGCGLGSAGTETGPRAGCEEEDGLSADDFSGQETANDRA